jgi:hypothetical protein
LAERCGVPPTPRPGQGETLCRPHTETNCRWVTFPVMPWSWRSGMRASGELRRTEAADQNTRRNLARNRVWVPQVASRQRSPKGGNDQKGNPQRAGFLFPVAGHQPRPRPVSARAGRLFGCISARPTGGEDAACGFVSRGPFASLSPGLVSAEKLVAQQLLPVSEPP